MAHIQTAKINLTDCDFFVNQHSFTTTNHPVSSNLNSKGLASRYILMTVCTPVPSIKPNGDDIRSFVNL